MNQALATAAHNFIAAAMVSSTAGDEQAIDGSTIITE